MIRNILVLDHTGRVIVNRTYNEILSFEHRLIGGFLSAMTQFSQETFSDLVREIHFSKMRILLKRNEGFCIVGISDLNDDIEMINDILNRISKKLNHWHKNALSKNDTPTQQTIRCIEQLIDNLMLPYRTFESKKSVSRSVHMKSTSSK